MLQDKSYNIVFGCDDNYIKYAAVAMSSIICSLNIDTNALLSAKSLSNVDVLGNERERETRLRFA